MFPHSEYSRSILKTYCKANDDIEEDNKYNSCRKELPYKERLHKTFQFGKETAEVSPTCLQIIKGKQKKKVEAQKLEGSQGNC